MDPLIHETWLDGRGRADAGYSIFSCMLAIKNAHLQGVATPRCTMVLESEEESGSPNLVRLLKEAKDLIGKPDVCICMEACASNYDQMWVTSSFRGLVCIDLAV